jgi:transcriptional regulator with XRE-family HTH domain
MKPRHEIKQEMELARLRAGLTQAELAQRMRTTQSVIARMEAGRNLPTMRTLEKVAKATGHRLEVQLVCIHGL